MLAAEGQLLKTPHISYKYEKLKIPIKFKPATKQVSSNSLIYHCSANLKFPVMEFSVFRHRSQNSVFPIMELRI